MRGSFAIFNSTCTKTKAQYVTFAVVSGHLKRDVTKLTNMCRIKGDGARIALLTEWKVIDFGILHSGTTHRKEVKEVERGVQQRNDADGSSRSQWRYKEL